MNKSFTDWHRVKSTIESEYRSPFFREGEVWWCAIGLNVGVEEDGKNMLFERPVVIFRKFNHQMLWAFPMTSTNKQGRPYFSLKIHEKDGVAILSQLRILSGKRLIRRIGKIRTKKFAALNKAFILFLNETDPLRDPRVPMWQ